MFVAFDRGPRAISSWIAPIPNVANGDGEAIVERIDRLHDPLPASVGELLSESERAGVRFVRRLVEEWASGANRFDRPGEALFGAWIDGRLIGVCGLNVDPYAHDARVGRVRHLYVRIGFRRLGTGRRLVMRVVEAARDPFDSLRLRTNNPAAAGLYEALGFRPSVGPGDCTHVLDPESRHRGDR